MKNKNYYSNENYEAENSMKTKAEGKMSNMKKRVLIISIVIFVILCIGVTTYLKRTKNANGLIGIGEEVTITDVTLRNDLMAIEQVSSYEVNYAGIAKIEDTKEIAGLKLGFTKHVIDVAYEGKIKAYYDLDVLKNAIINPITKTITLDLPEKPEIDIIPGETKVQQKNNILNLIEADEVTEQLEIEQNMQLEKAVEKGLYEKAEKHFKEIVQDFLDSYGDKYKGYKVK